MPAIDTIFIDGLQVDPRLVIALPEHQGLDTRNIEVRLPVDVVLHELHESCDSSLTEESLRDFLVTDTQECSGRDAYLLFARAVAGIPSDEKQNGPFRWAWTYTKGVTIESAIVCLTGTAAAL